MVNVKAMYREIFFNSIMLNLFDALITAFAVFSIGLIITYFNRLSFLFAAGAGFAVFIRSIIVKTKQNKILVLEKKYPDLNEKLRTSFDYQEKVNTVINELHSEILGVIKKIDVHTFLNFRMLFLKIVVICAMLFTVLYMASYGVDIVAAQRAVVNSQGYKAATGFIKDIISDESSQELALLDKPRLIQLGDKEYNITIDTFNTELDISEVKDADDREFGGYYPEEIAGAAEEVYIEGIPEEHKDVVKEYFKKINK